MSALDVDAAARALASRAVDQRFSRVEVDGLPESVERYLAASISLGTAIATAATMGMRGRIKIGRSVPFRAEEVLAPHRGFVWRARAAGVISGYDAYIDGRGAMQWKLLGLATVMRAEDGDVAKSAAGRCGGEALWLPTALLPRFDVRWSAESSDHIVASFDLDATPLEIHLRIDERGLPTTVVLDRWGDPDRTGSFGWHRFGGTITDHQTSNGITVPSTGSWGWHHGTDRWSVGEFFRCRVTAHLPR
jgi:hypothetical protein